MSVTERKEADINLGHVCLVPDGRIAMKTMTLNLSEAEMAVLDALAKRKGMSKTAVLRQALRLYVLIDEKRERGWTFYTEGDRLDKAELMIF